MIMKTTETKNTKNLTANFDTQLLTILKDDLRQQNQKIKATLINMATRTYDSELLAIIKEDINKVRQAMGNSSNTFAQAG